MGGGSDWGGEGGRLCGAAALWQAREGERGGGGVSVCV